MKALIVKSKTLKYMIVHYHVIYRKITMKALIVKSKTLNYITLLYTEKESLKKVVLDRKEITLRN